MPGLLGACATGAGRPTTRLAGGGLPGSGSLGDGRPTAGQGNATHVATSVPSRDGTHDRVLFSVLLDDAWITAEATRGETESTAVFGVKVGAGTGSKDCFDGGASQLGERVAAPAPCLHLIGCACGTAGIVAVPR